MQLDFKISEGVTPGYVGSRVHIPRGVILINREAIVSENKERRAAKFEKSLARCHDSIDQVTSALLEHPNGLRS